MIKYISSFGEEFDLQMVGRLNIKDANFHSYAWTAEGIQRQYGLEVDKFVKNAYEYKASLVFSGDLESRKKKINTFHDAIERDILTVRPGRLTYGSYYIDCFIRSSETYPDKNSKTVNDIVILAPYPFWISEQRFDITAQTSGETMANAKGYPMRYPYSFARTRKANRIHIDHYTESDFKLTIFGPTDRVQIEIAGHPYIVEYPIAEDEYMVIDSRPSAPIGKQIYIVRTNGQEENIFNYRSCEHSVFKKIPAGDILIDYPGTYGFDLTVFKERSEPRF